MKKMIKKKILPFIYAYLARFLMRLIILSCKVEIHGMEKFKETAKSERCILMLWHNCLAVIADIMTRHAPEFQYASVVSNSRDGEIIAKLTESYKQGIAIRVPHNARSAALQTMIQKLRYGKMIMIITPDGPKGPIHKVKPGVAVMAKETGAAVIPWSWSSNSVWNLPTWDGLKLPKPFSKIEVRLGEPLHLEKGELSPTEEEIAKLEDALNQISIKSASLA